MTDTWTTTVAEDVWTSSTNPGTVFQVVIADPNAGGGGVSDHGALTGLSDDDHTQYAKKASNLSDLASAATARTNLGLGTAAVAATGDFDAAGTAAGLVDDLSGVSNQATARTNLGLGTAAVTDTGTGSSNVILGNDARLTDSRTPTSHNHAASEITSGTIDQARLGTGSAGAGAKFLADDQTYKTVSSGIADPGGANDDFLQRKSGAWTNRTVAQVKTDLGVFGANRWPLAANDHIDLSERHGAGYVSTALSSNAANSNNLVIYVPFLIGKTISVDQLSIVCAGGNDGASAVVRLGIYAESSGRPGSVVVDAGTASINATGTKSLGFTAVQLAPGWYFAAIAVQGVNTSGSNPTFSSVSSVKQMSPMPTIASSNDIGGFMSTSSISGAFAANPTVSHIRVSAGLPAFRINMRVSTP